MRQVSASTFTWAELLGEATARVGARDARRIVEEVSGLEGAEWVLGQDGAATRRAVARLDDMVARRAAGEPLQYVVGRWGFRSLDLLVDRRVLIPRPETEQVVEVVLGELRRHGRDGHSLTAVDLGTGSGAIALAVAAEVPGVTVWGTERSAEALVVARANLAGLGRKARSVRMVEGDWFGALPGDLRGGVDLVVANPPYVAEGEALPAEVARWEPAEALVAGPSGTEALEHIVDQAPVWLARPGALVLELAPHQAGAVAARARAAGFAEVDVRPDLSGRDRALVARF
jgi:release factor glutamine methyltransferase